MSIEFPSLLDQVKAQGISSIQLYEQTYAVKIPGEIKISMGKYFPHLRGGFDLVLLEAVETKTPIVDWDQLIAGLMRLVT